ncbi:restriction endonuclease [Micromonospora sp. CPCC 205539]|uniref:restriction endonuclease n=1 Tax=Micromonospora sp. CPCC 205539 TaxID=3122408 RepID=UPI002FEEBB34
MSIMDLDTALHAFDRTEANIVRLEKLWKEMSGLIPDSVAFEGGSPENIRYRDLTRSFEEIRSALPSIDGWRPSAELFNDLDQIAQIRFDHLELDEPLSRHQFDRSVDAPGEEIADYRQRYSRKRRQVVRARLEQLSAEFDRMLAALVGRIPNNRELVDEPEYDQLEEIFAEIDRLLGTSSPRRGRWGDLRRHFHFRQGHDLHDIANLDWPSVRSDVAAGMYDDYEPVPVDVDDLGTLTDGRPSGPVTTALDWGALDDEQFERLAFNILTEASGYENIQWLMKTRAADRGRDLQATRVRIDPLSGTRRDRVIVQCKHWLSKSVTLHDISNNVAQMRLWEPPVVDVLVVATSGHFTADAVQWVEKRDEARERPTVELWSRGHLESLLAQRPNLAVTFGLR